MPPMRLLPSLVNEIATTPRKAKRGRLDPLITCLGMAAQYPWEIRSTFACDFLRSTSNGFPKNGAGNALGPVAFRILCKVWFARFSKRSGAYQRRQSASRSDSAQECFFDDEPVPLCCWTFDGGAVPKSERDRSAGRKRSHRAFFARCSRPKYLAKSSESARIQYRDEYRGIRRRRCA